VGISGERRRRGDVASKEGRMGKWAQDKLAALHGRATRRRCAQRIHCEREASGSD
jgi:hypothetical protein